MEVRLVRFVLLLLLLLLIGGTSAALSLSLTQGVWIIGPALILTLYFSLPMKASRVAEIARRRLLYAQDTPNSSRATSSASPHLHVALSALVRLRD